MFSGLYRPLTQTITVLIRAEHYLIGSNDNYNRSQGAGASRGVMTVDSELIFQNIHNIFNKAKLKTVHSKYKQCTSDRVQCTVYK